MAIQSIPEPGRWARMGLTLPHGYTQHPEVVVSLYYYKNLWCGKIHGLLRLATPASRYIKRCPQSHFLRLARHASVIVFVARMLAAPVQRELRAQNRLGKSADDARCEMHLLSAF